MPFAYCLFSYLYDVSLTLHKMSSVPLHYRIALGMIPGVGDITARRLVSYTGSVEAVFRESFRNLTRIPGAELALIKNAGHGFITDSAEESSSIILEFLNRHG